VQLGGKNEIVEIDESMFKKVQNILEEKI
jgi:hypothetical protein